MEYFEYCIPFRLCLVLQRVGDVNVIQPALSEPQIYIYQGRLSTSSCTFCYLIISFYAFTENWVRRLVISSPSMIDSGPTSTSLQAPIWQISAGVSTGPCPYLSSRIGKWSINSCSTLPENTLQSYCHCGQLIVFPKPMWWSQGRRWKGSCAQPSNVIQKWSFVLPGSRRGNLGISLVKRSRVLCLSSNKEDASCTEMSLEADDWVFLCFMSLWNISRWQTSIPGANEHCTTWMLLTPIVRILDAIRWPPWCFL